MQIQLGQIRINQITDILRNLLEDRAKLYKAGGTAALLVLTVYLAVPGIRAAGIAYQKYLTTKTSYVAQENQANDIPVQETALKEAQDKFKVLSNRFAFSVDTGQTLKRIADCCKRDNVALNSIQPGDPVEKVYQGHLMAVPIKVEVTGAFPDIIKAMNDIEHDGNPAEFREVKISTAQKGAPGDVTAHLTIVFYSLYKPEMTQYVTATISGNYNPFFALKQPSQAPFQQSQPGLEKQLPLVNQVLPGDNTSPVSGQPSVQPGSEQQPVSEQQQTVK
ncbi:Pilus assembly protein, PilO [Pelotomaculum schinkii]|uniref:Pilus assembly protein, PilO n=1 Tax=Pelotomaculum schinkii TaxID=78350 RepID=A0A4Y7R7N3_9FIRM|nr:type 4a pilus biogenesis protein PilO [Pelotomaculum schinkii]TEB04729.1 Pilus assembly protein, PilO [Pelotomaculum schinkii]